jgi:hypothetical protein
MGAASWQLGRLADDVEQLNRRGLPREQYFAEVAARLRRVIDCDATCWHTLDPQTKLMTSDAPQELISEGVFTAAGAAAAGALLVRSEYLLADVNTFAGLAARRIPVGILGEVSRGRPERSARYRDLLAPAGIPFELRAAFVARGRCWGAVHLARREHKRDFTAEDAGALAHVAGTIAEGIRTSIRFDAARNPRDAAAPGLVVLGPANEVELITPPARELIAALRSPALAQTGETPPTPCSRSHRSRVGASVPATPGPTSSPCLRRMAGSPCTPRCRKDAPTAGSRSSWSGPPARTRRRCTSRRTA